MSKRVCSKSGCPAIIDAGRRGGLCATHAREADRARGTSAERGYGAEHAARRREWQRAIDAGVPVHCWRCGIRLTGTSWHLDHTDDRTGYRGPACPACNLHLAGIARHRR